ncbi:MAG: threonine/serine exporter family protein [Bacteroidales bacterium]|jgi:uncharacterized membrane protein YjjB (DUF3815 family)|nr:threonine/serine exporter family protein [Bacteroidales bacterium]
MELFTGALFDFGISLVVAMCWGILFGTPSRALFAAGLLGGIGHSLRFLLLTAGLGLIASTMVASVTIGLLGIFSAHRIHHPPVVITLPASITMIPGLYAYRSMLGGIKLTNLENLDAHPGLLTGIAHNVMLTFSLLFTLAIGISISALLFRNKSVKEIRFNKSSILKNKAT